MNSELKRQHDPTLFAGTASYYARYRFPYPQPLFDYLAQTLGFDGTGVAMDLGCGTGQLALRLAGYFEKVVAIDPDDGMLAEARIAADSAGRSNIEFRRGSSWDLSPAPGGFRFVIMGQSFHWMDRDQVLANVHDMLQARGAVAVVYQERYPPGAIESAEDETVKKFLGERRRAGQGFYEHPAEKHEVIFARSPFAVLAPWHYGYEREQTVEEAAGSTFSTSRASKPLLGAATGAFEAELRRRLLEAAPAGKFPLRVEVTALLASRD